MCTNDGQTHFYFDHTNPNEIYYSPDIDTGISGTVTPVVGEQFTATIQVHNEGNIGGNAEVELCVCPPGTGITSVLNVPVPTVALTGSAQNPGVPACDPNQPGFTTAAQISWTVPSTNSSHFCLCVMVRDTALNAPDGAYPSVLSGSTLSPAFSPTNARSAQCNVSLVQGGGRPALLPRRPFCTDFAFAVVNPLHESIVSQVVAYPIKPDDGTIIKTLSKQSQIAQARKLGRFQAPHRAELAVGRERILRPDIGGDAHQAACSGMLGHLGTITPEAFSRLAVTSLRPEQTMKLVANEIRQSIVHICAPEGAAPGDLFGVDIRHEILQRGSSDRSRVLGGIVVILRIPHPDDREFARRLKRA